MTRFTSKLLLIAALALVATSANATVWVISGGGLDSWLTNGTNGGTSETVYESGFGTNAASPIPAPRVDGYNCFGLTGGADVNCADNDGTGPDTAASEIWGAAASYFGSYDDNGTQGDASDDTGTFGWTGESGTAVAAGTLFELFTASVVSGSYDVASGIVSTGVADVTSGGLGGGLNCWNNALASQTFYGANFCGNGTGISSFTTSPQTIASRFLPNGSINFVRNSGDGSITVTMSSTTYSSCTAADPLTCGSSSTDVFATWTLTSSTVPVPAAVWLFGSALGLLGWLRRKTS